MEKVIKIGKQEIKLSNNVAWTMEYRDQFGKDIIPVIMPLISTAIEAVASVVTEAGGENLTVTSIAEAIQGRALDILLPLYQVELTETVINVTWAMARAADDSIDPPKKWVRQFESFPLDVIIPNVNELVMKGFVSSKNLKRLKELGANLKRLQPSLSMTSSSQDSSED